MARQSLSRDFWSVVLQADERTALSSSSRQATDSLPSMMKDVDLSSGPGLCTQDALPADITTSFIHEAMTSNGLEPSTAPDLDDDNTPRVIVAPRVSDFPQEDTDELYHDNEILDGCEVFQDEETNRNVHAQSANTTEEERTRILVIQAIEKIVESILQQLVDATGPIQFPVVPRAIVGVAGPSEFDAFSTPSRAPNAVFPSRDERRVWRFAVLLSIISHIYAALVEKVTITLRDIYYKDKDLFRKQSIVDYYVLSLAKKLGVPRRALNVLAVAKGLVSGLFVIRDRHGTPLDGFIEPEGVLIPQMHDDYVIDLKDVSWILVIEKEATFQTISSAQFYRNARIGDGLIVTGKGYPDMLTRTFVRRLSTVLQVDRTSVPIFALMDYDPDGFAIMCTYKYGSKYLAHENAALRVPRIQWIGPKSSDLQANESDDTGLLHLTERDRKLARIMLGNTDLDEECKRELQIMLMLNYKAEIQLLSGRPGELELWLEEKIMAYGL